MKMLRIISIVLSCSLILSACTSIEVLDDGRVKREWDSSIYPGKKVVYVGSWEQGKPSGKGKLESPGFSCDGEFFFQTLSDRVDSPVMRRVRELSNSLNGDIYYRKVSWGKGNVYYNGTLFYQGTFYSWLDNDEANLVCVPDGRGTVLLNYSKGTVKITGTLEEGNVLTINDGPCRIETANHVVFTGKCVDKYKALSGDEKKSLIGNNPLVYADVGEGTITYPDGTVLAGFFYRSGAIVDGLFVIERNGKLPEEVVFENNQQISPSPEQLAFLRSREAERKESERIAREEEHQRLLAQQELKRQRAEEEASQPSAASQIAQFGTLFLGAYSQQLENKRAERASSGPTVFDITARSEKKLAQQNEQWRAEAASKQGQQYQQRQQTPSNARADASSSSIQPNTGSTNGQNQLEQGSQKNGELLNRQAQKQEQVRRDEALQSRIIVGEGDSGNMCHIREVAEKMAQGGAQLSASDECRALGSGWYFDGVRFSGYFGCTPCGGGEKGNFKCKVTQATFNCKHR